MSHFDILILTETWLNSSSFNGEYFDTKMYNVFRKDRDFSVTSMRRGGGVLIAAQKEVQITVIDPVQVCRQFTDLKLIDILAAKIRLGHKFLYVIVLYIHPSCGVHDYSSLFECLMSANINFNSNLLVLGDCNIPEFLNCYSGNTASSNIYNACDNFCHFFGLSPKILSPI